jgi:excisionase family DNA binding protein
VTNADCYLSVAELPGLTSLSLRTWRGFISRGDLPHFRVGGRVLVKWADVVEFLEGFRVAAAAAQSQPSAREQARELVAAMRSPDM